MIMLWFVAGAALAVSLVALLGLRRALKRIEDLSQQYWALRYQQGELRAQVLASGLPKPHDAPDTPSRAPAEAFVPLSAVRR